MNRTHFRQMKGVIVSLVFTVASGLVLARVAEMTNNVIIIQTPGKTDDGAPTHTNFPHKRHVDEFGATCDTCHPAIDASINSPVNNQTNVHDVCRQCHAKNKPGKSFACIRCHIK
jgi:ribosomal protein L40E